MSMGAPGREIYAQDILSQHSRYGVRPSERKEGGRGRDARFVDAEIGVNLQWNQRVGALEPERRRRTCTMKTPKSRALRMTPIKSGANLARGELQL